MRFHAVNAAPVVVESSDKAKQVAFVIGLDDDLWRAKLNGDATPKHLHHHANKGHRVERKTGKIIDFDPVAPHQLVAFLRQFAWQINEADLSCVNDKIAISLARFPLLQNGGRLVRFG